MVERKILFQIIDWSENYDVITELDDNEKEVENKLYTIRVYGRDEENNSVFLKIKNFKPYFYIEVPITWGNNMIISLINHLKFSINKYVINGFDTYETEEKHNFYGFTDYSKFKFIKLINKIDNFIFLFQLKCLLSLIFSTNLFLIQNTLPIMLRNPRNVFRYYFQNLYPYACPLARLAYIIIAVKIPEYYRA